MRILDEATIYSIKEGQVVKFKYPNGRIVTGVVCETAHGAVRGNVVHCKTEENESFYITRYGVERGETEFEVLEDHSPVSQYGPLNRWDFVSNHQ